jgi:hypothetical protein
MRAAHLSIALETSGCDDSSQNEIADDWAAGLWRCVEAAMVTADGGPLIDVPPPGQTFLPDSLFEMQEFG